MLKGSITALITPFRGDQVDDSGFQAFVDWQIKEGSHGVVACGTTGEAPTLSHPEHKRVVELCVEAADGRVPVIAGTGSNCTAEAIELTRHAEQAGADAALIVTPYYNKPTQAGLYAHFKAIHDATDIPIVIYNIPPRSVIDMSVETMAMLAKLPNVVGVKDATAKLDRVSRQRRECGPDFIQLSGEDGTALALMAHGGQGCISVTANAAPKPCSEFQEACMRGDFREALRYQDRLMVLHEALFIEASPGPVKYAASLLDKAAPDTRLPLAPIAETSKRAVEGAMRAAGLLN